MEKITIEGARKMLAHVPIRLEDWELENAMHIFNKAVDEANAEIAELQQQADHWKKEFDYTFDEAVRISKRYFDLLKLNPKNPSQVKEQPSSLTTEEPSVRDYEQSINWIAENHNGLVRRVTELEQRIEELEASCIMDGEVVLIHGIGNKLITKIK